MCFERKTKMKTKKIIILSFALAIVGLLTSCGTVHGFGKDMSRAGREIQRAAS